MNKKEKEYEKKIALSKKELFDKKERNNKGFHQVKSDAFSVNKRSKS